MNPYLYETVMEWLPQGSRILDLGTGNGRFLSRVIREKQIYGEGVEKNPKLLAQCIEAGIIAYQGDVLEGLDQYPKQSFDYVLLLGTFQELLSPREVLTASFRVASHVILAFSNFAYWYDRVQLMFRGRSPTSGDSLPWYDSPNVQFFSHIDFCRFCQTYKIDQIKSAYFHNKGRIKFLANLRAHEVLSLLKKH